jgi:hypothetical protein
VEVCRSQAIKAALKSENAGKELSKALKRTPAALKQKALALGIPLGHRRTK